jgi:hypothetical protein
VRQALDSRESFAEAELVVQETTGGNAGFNEATRVGRAYLAVARAAFGKRCFELVRSIYLEVINKFADNSYTFFREQARIGIDDARAAMK